MILHNLLFAEVVYGIERVVDGRIQLCGILPLLRGQKDPRTAILPRSKKYCVVMSLTRIS